MYLNIKEFLLRSIFTKNTQNGTFLFCFHQLKKYIFVITDILMIVGELTVKEVNHACFKNIVFWEICVDRLMTGDLRDKMVTKYLYLAGMSRLNLQSSYYRKMHFKDEAFQTRVELIFYFSTNRKSRWFSRIKMIYHILYMIYLTEVKCWPVSLT